MRPDGGRPQALTAGVPRPGHRNGSRDRRNGPRPHRNGPRGATHARVAMRRGADPGTGQASRRGASRSGGILLSADPSRRAGGSGDHREARVVPVGQGAGGEGARTPPRRSASRSGGSSYPGAAAPLPRAGPAPARRPRAVPVGARAVPAVPRTHPDRSGQGCRGLFRWELRAAPVERQARSAAPAGRSGGVRGRDRGPFRRVAIRTGSAGRSGGDASRSGAFAGRSCRGAGCYGGVGATRTARQSTPAADGGILTRKIAGPSGTIACGVFQ